MKNEKARTPNAEVIYRFSLSIFYYELWFFSDKDTSYSYCRFVVGSRLTNTEDVEFAWNEILRHADIMEMEGKIKRAQNI